MHLVQLSIAGNDLAPPLSLDQSGLRLPQVLARHVDRSRPFMVAIRRKGDHDSSLNELWVTRGWKVEPVRDEFGQLVTPGIVNPWPRRYIGKGSTVVVVYMPQGGGSGAAGAASRGKSPLAIVAGIAGIALAAFAGPLAGALLPAGLAAVVGQAAFVLGGPAVGRFRSHPRN